MIVHLSHKVPRGTYWTRTIYTLCGAEGHTNTAVTVSAAALQRIPIGNYEALCADCAIISLATNLAEELDE